MHSLINTIQSLQQSNAQMSSANTMKVIAETIFEDLKTSGLRDKDIVAVSSEILNRLTLDIQARFAAQGTDAVSVRQ
jgi:hypothetical protein